MSKSLTCEQLVEYLSDYIDNNLDEDFTIAAQEHLATCQNCRVVLDSTQQMIVLYRQQEQQKIMPSDRQQKVYSRLEAAFKQRQNEKNEN